MLVRRSIETASIVKLSDPKKDATDGLKIRQCGILFGCLRRHLAVENQHTIITLNFIVGVAITFISKFINPVAYRKN